MTDLKPGDRVCPVDNFAVAGTVLEAGLGIAGDVARVKWDHRKQGLLSVLYEHRLTRQPALPNPDPEPEPDRGYAAGLADAVAWLRRSYRPAAADGLQYAVDAGTFTAPPVPDLPTEPGTIITWTNRAYLPHLAQLDGGHARLGWRNTGDDSTERWLTADQLAERINGARWVRLVPAVDL